MIYDLLEVDAVAEWSMIQISEFDEITNCRMVFFRFITTTLLFRKLFVNLFCCFVADDPVVLADNEIDWDLDAGVWIINLVSILVLLFAQF